MQCPGCGAPNDPGRVYCGSCAQRLAVPCPVCQFLNSRGDRYCGGCAGDLRAAAGLRGASPESPCAPLPLPGGAPPRAAEIFAELGDLSAPVAPAAGEAAPRSPAADLTQEEVDGFFRRLVREGVAEIGPAAAEDRSPDGSGKAAP